MNYNLKNESFKVTIVRFFFQMLVGAPAHQLLKKDPQIYTNDDTGGPCLFEKISVGEHVSEVVRTMVRNDHGIDWYIITHTVDLIDWTRCCRSFVCSCACRATSPRSSPL